METATHCRFRFTIREMFFLVLTVALILGWASDRSRLADQLNSARTERRYVTRLTSGVATVGMTQDDVQLALGAPHYVATSDGKTTWLYYYEAPDGARPLTTLFMSGDYVEDSLRIEFGIDDRVAKVTDFALRR